ncbi:PNK3P, AAA 33, and/or Zeta toxin domain containing protein [Asbolus verrucosus]|uniref:PNK3P, AAA 33, and/or Zeta toxin domain containing protein n=1 Tax=Asbolus verrucosus TaxID=1661398 RepID=A0A482VFV9_ASBVE|nr:PNK3P, AAA 33, and/or Zeta toxin domain containing protein [Asbolus verrucosus]
MAFSSRICYLKCARNAQKRINLPHQKPVMIGRNEETGITDLHVSRNHLECTADIDSSQVLVKTLGKSHSGCNGYALMQGETYTLKHGDRIEVRLGFHEFDIIFESPDEDNEPKPKKQKLDFFNLNTNTNMKFSNSGTWEEIDGKDLLIYTSDNCGGQPAIAGFDLDGTIIKTKSGARFPKDPDDWVLNINSIPQKLQQLHEKNHKVVIFSNQSGLGNDFSKMKGYKGKIEAIVAKLSVPTQVFIATGKSIYRKPAPGMWDILCESKNENVPVDVNESFFVGDAAGREKNWAPKKNKDHSMSDRLFALNIGLKFYTPEEYFLKSSSVAYTMPEFDPRNIPDEVYPHISADQQEVILMVGGPASGKSFYCKNQLIPKGYVHVSRDKLGTWQKCAKSLEECIQRNQSVVIDNTNPDKESRQRFIDVAKRHGVSCRCFVMATTHKHAKHNNRFRELTDKSHLTVGELVLNSYKKGFQEPELSEGFSEIVKVPFIPKFNNPEHEKLYRMFLLED